LRCRVGLGGKKKSGRDGTNGARDYLGIDEKPVELKVGNRDL
jgi:hypothetical protein